MRWVIPFLAAFAVLTGQALASDRDTRTEWLLELSGAHALLDGFAHQIGGPDNPMAHASLGMADAWAVSAAEHFQPDAMFADMVQHFQATLDPADRATILSFYQSDLGMRISAIEISAQRPENAVRLKTSGARRLGDLIEAESPRLAAYEDMMAALSSVETGLALALNLNKAVLNGMIASGDFPFAMTEDQVSAMVESQSGLMQGAIREQLFISFAYTYRDLTDAELEIYIAFLRSEAGRRFYSELVAATDAIMSERARAFGKRLMELRASKPL